MTRPTATELDAHPGPAHGTGAARRPRRGPGSKADADHPTRQQLLDAALTLLDAHELGELSVADLTRGAGVAKGTFYVHFADRDAFVLTLHQWFHDDLFGEIETATASLPPGAERLVARLIAFLDGCRRRRGVRSMLWSAGRKPAIQQEIERRNGEATATLAEDLRAMGRSVLVDETARLIVAATTEVAALELAAGNQLTGMRDALALLATESGRISASGQTAQTGKKGRAQ